MKRGQTTARSGLRLRSAPKTGAVIGALAYGSQVEVLGEETWLKVKTSNGMEGYVLSDYVELSSIKGPIHSAESAEPKIITYQPFSARIQGKPVKIDIGFKPVMKWIEEKLIEHDINMWITSSLREPGKPVSSAVVDPASLSNHFVGHAIDMNLFIQNDWFNSNRLQRIDIHDDAKNSEFNPDNEEKVRRFLYSVEYLSASELGLKLRWGGLFSPADYVHIDDGYNREESSQYWASLNHIWPSYTV